MNIENSSTLRPERRGPSWPLVLGLGAFALLRPLMSLGGVDELVGRPAAPLLATALITIVWVAAIVVARPARPLLTGVLAGVAYGVLALALGAILSPVLTGELRGPLASPVALVPMLATNALWGTIAGAVATAVLARGVARPMMESQEKRQRPARSADNTGPRQRHEHP